MLLIREKLIESGLSIEKRQAIAIIALVICVIVGSIVFYIKSRPQPVIISKTEAKTEARPSRQSPQEKSKPEQLAFVHVTGAVVNPGVYQLKEGTRVIDAIKAAGGAISEADESALNLAAKITDGQKIVVPKKGEAPPVQSAAASSGDGAVSSEGAKINLNTATAEQLDTLPGVGQVTATKIIDYRTKNGSFKRVDELKEVDGIGSKKFDQLKDKLCVD